MFEVYIFQSGGLILWPENCESNRKTMFAVDEYVQKQVLEGRATTGSYTKDSYTCVTHHDVEHNLFYTVALNKQIAERITYLNDFLDRIQEKFSLQFKQLLSIRDAFLLPSNFRKFSIDDIIEEFRGAINTPVSKPSVKVEGSESDSESANDNSKSNSPNNSTMKKSQSAGNMKQSKENSRARSVSPSGRVSKARKHYSDKNFNTSDSDSIVIRNKKDREDAIQIEEVDLNDMEGIFPTQKTSRLSGLFRSIVGEKELTEQSLNPILEQFEQHLISKNVASAISKELTSNVGKKLIGTKCGNFDSVKTIVTNALREDIERIMTPQRSLDIIRDIQTANEAGKPFSIAFVGVNGVGKSTSLAKVAYLLKGHNFKVLIAACDTYRSGAVDQLKVHSDRLNIELFEKGGGRKDPVPVAREALKYATEKNFNVVLIDTAGRMQHDDNLMKQIARLVNTVKPDLTVFVAEALVGNNGSDQIQSFDEALKRFEGRADARGLDGIILTKFDTIDDKVGAALTLVYETGHPIVFLGVGQHYRDLRKMNPEFVVSTLLSGF